MSYILDALKRSEEERHQGQLPNLGSNSALIHNPKSKSPQWPWVIAVLLVLNVASVSYWILKEPSERQVVTEKVAEKTSSANDRRELLTQDANVLAAKVMPVVKPERREVATVVNQPATIQVPVQNDAIRPSATSIASQQYQPSGIPNSTATNAYQIQPSQGYSQGATTQENQLVPPKVIVPGASYQTKADAEPTVSEPKDDEPLLITPKGKSRPYTGPAYTGSDIAYSENKHVPNRANSHQGESSTADLASIPRISDKPHEFQIQIPDMAFNSHIYTDTPSSRRVMINNIYLREGQTFSGMKVEHITEEGIVLSLDNQPFKMGVLRDWYSPR